MILSSFTEVIFTNKEYMWGFFSAVVQTRLEGIRGGKWTTTKYPTKNKSGYMIWGKIDEL